MGQTTKRQRECPTKKTTKTTKTEEKGKAKEKGKMQKPDCVPKKLLQLGLKQPKRQLGFLKRAAGQSAFRGWTV